MAVSHSSPSPIERGKTSGAVPIGSPADFATAWLRAYAEFIGIRDFTSVGQAGEADEAAALGDRAVDAALARVANGDATDPHAEGP